MPASYALHYGRQATPLCHVNPDDKYPSMYRIHWPDGEVSDMVNLSRAKDAASVLARRRHGIHDPSMLSWMPGRAAGEPATSI